MSARTAARVGWTACGLSLVCGAATGVLIAIHSSEPLNDWLDASTQEVVVGFSALVGYSVFGALIVSRHRSNPIGWLFVAAGFGAGFGGLARELGTEALVVNPGSLPAGEAMAWLGAWSWILFVPVPGTVALLLFPTGRLPSPRWRPALWLAIAVNAGLVLGFGFQTGEIDGYGIDNPLGFVPEGVEAVGALLIPLVVLCFVSLVFRYRSAEGEERQQLRWMAAAAVLYLVAILAEFTIALATGDWYGWPSLLATVAVVVAAGVAVLKYRLYDLDLVVNRALVYGLLTVLVAAAYVGMVVGLGELLDGSGLGVSLAATAVVAVAIQPLRSVVQRRVDRLMYGDRDDPYRALARLGERLGQALEPDAVLPAIVEAVADGLRLPYVAIELPEGGEHRIAASHGALRGGEPVRLQLEYRGDAVGRLVVSPRPGSGRLAPADLRLLAALARQAGVAAHAVRLTWDLRRSRERLVAAREEERRRLRRDLHDGLGPALAGIALEVESARAVVDRDPAAARELLARLRGEVQESIADIRRIAYDLRPPTLDELGLVAAVREQAARLGTSVNGARAPAPMRVEVDAPADLPQLGAAVEVAAYRIVLEALTNVSRHAGAQTCRVRIAVNGALEVEVSDDGRGLGNGSPRGIGLTSMRERAEELGGSLAVTSEGRGGTVVFARLPLEPV